MKKVLIVDDEKLIRSSLVEILEDLYDADEAASGKEALEKIDQKEYDLLISDINMSPINGIELINTIRRLKPDLKYALITGYQVESYIRLIREHKITNVITKSTPFDFPEFLTIVENILYPHKAFGLNRYLDTHREIFECEVRTMEDKKESVETVLSYVKSVLGERFEVNDIRLILEELINNALFHGFRDEQGEEKYNAATFSSLGKDEKLVVEYGKSDNHIGFAVADNAGNLTIDKVLFALERQISLEGLFDQSGRGIFLSRLLATQMIVNIEHKKRTQFIILISRSAAKILRHHRPLYINYS